MTLPSLTRAALARSAIDMPTIAFGLSMMMVASRRAAGGSSGSADLRRAIGESGYPLGGAGSGGLCFATCWATPQRSQIVHAAKAPSLDGSHRFRCTVACRVALVRILDEARAGFGYGRIVGIFLGHETPAAATPVFRQYVRNTMNPKFEFLLRLRVFALVAASGALLVALQMSGLSRDVGIWIWAAGTVILIGLILGPPLAKLVGGRTALVFGAILFGLGVATYLYVAYVMLPDAIERANADGGKQQSAQPR